MSASGSRKRARSPSIELLPNRRARRSPSLELLAYVRTAPAPFDRPGDLIIRTAQQTRYHVSHTLLSFASTYFQNLQLNRDANNERILVVPESDAVIETILRLTYPVPDPVLRDIDDIADAYVAALKYALPTAAHALQAMLRVFTASDPLRIYALARRFELAEEAETAALHACKTPPADWVLPEEFAHISAVQYHELLQFHGRRARAAATLVNERSLCGTCARCKRKWSRKWKKMAVERLLLAPTDEEVFSAASVGTLAQEIDCGKCSHDMLQALRPMGTLTRLKACLDDLPSTITSSGCS